LAGVVAPPDVPGLAPARVTGDDDSTLVGAGLGRQRQGEWARRRRGDVRGLPGVLGVDVGNASHALRVVAGFD
jgi:hypothetical protein